MYRSALNGARYLPGGPEEGFPEETFQLDLGGGLVWGGSREEERKDPLSQEGRATNKGIRR